MEASTLDRLGEAPVPKGSTPAIGGGEGNSADRVHALAIAGRYAEALRLAQDELAKAPGEPELLFARASVLFDWGRVREAREGFLTAEACGLARTALFLNLAWSSHLLRRAQDAERYARRALELDPASEAARIGLATVLQRLKRYPEAIAVYEEALARNPQAANCLAGVAYCKLEQRDYVGAQAWLQRALALAPQVAPMWVNLGVALANLEHYQEALDAFRRAEALENEQGLAHESVIDHARALVDTGQDAAVVELLRRHLPRLSDPRALSHYAFTLLTLGRFREGWEHYEVRWLQEPHLSHRPGYDKPVWAGQPLAGKTVLIRPEQGAGDIVQFARYASLLKARGALVILEARPELIRLARGFADVDQVFTPPAAAPHFDFYIHALGLPRAFATEVATIPNPGAYLAVDAQARAQWAARVTGTGLRVGLAWPAIRGIRATASAPSRSRSYPICSRSKASISTRCRSSRSKASSTPSHRIRASRISATT